MKKLIYILGGVLFAASTGCSDFLDINETPNNPVAVTPDVLLPTAQAGTAFANNNELNRFASTIMSVTAGAGGSPAGYDIYNLDGADFGNQWRFEIYNGALITYQATIEAAAGLNSPTYTGISKIMKAYTWSLATDVWGDIPYSEALRGDEIVQPRLDSQRDIYMGAEGIQSLFDLVREGLSDLERSSPVVNPGLDDLIYQGNIEYWRRAGYSLMLKMANTISFVEPDFARQIISEVIAAGQYIESNEQNLSVTFGSAVGSRAPVFEWTNISLFRNDLIISTRFVNRLQGLNDPRLPIFVTRPTGEYVTVDNGFRGTLPQPQTTWSRFSPYVTGTDGQGPVRLLTNAQTKFILAESALMLGTAGDAQAYYQDGIRASMRLAGVPAASIDAYFAANPNVVTLNGSQQQNLEKIITQKYISLYGNGLEQWNDWRRTGYPVLPDHQNVVGIDGTRPVRAQYINEEIARNPNFDVVLPNVPVWWDVN